MSDSKNDDDDDEELGGGKKEIKRTKKRKKKKKGERGKKRLFEKRLIKSLSYFPFLYLDTCINAVIFSSLFNPRPRSWGILLFLKLPSKFLGGGFFCEIDGKRKLFFKNLYHGFYII